MFDFKSFVHKGVVRLGAVGRNDDDTRTDVQAAHQERIVVRPNGERDCLADDARYAVAWTHNLGAITYGAFTVGGIV